MIALLVGAVVVVYLHFLLEWLFFVTKPSFLAVMPWGERLRVLLVAPLPPVAVLLIAGALLWPLARLLPAVGVLVGRTVLAAVLAACGFILIDNFTYTVFGFGVVSTDDPERFWYVALLVVLFAWFYRRFPASRVRARWTGVLAGGLIAASVSAALWQLAVSPSPPTFAAEDTPPTRRLPNILILSSDGVDAARTSLYGAARRTTPFLEQMARKSLVFENAFPNINSSAGSLTSLLTGKAPLRTGLFLHPDILTGLDAYQHLPGILKGLGYQSIHVSTRLYTDPFEENMQHAFDVSNFREADGALGLPALPGRIGLAYTPTLHFLGEVYGRLSERVLHAAGIEPMVNPLAQLEAGLWVSDEARINAILDFFDRADRPVFAQLHLMGTHIPLVPRQPVFSAPPQPAGRFQRTINAYDDTISDFDRNVQGIVAHLAVTQKLSNTVVVVTSDHGWWWSYARLPLLLRFPGGQPQGRRTENAQLIDIAPTLLDYLGLPIPAWMDGASLLGPLDRKRPITSLKIRQKHQGPVRTVTDVGLTVCERDYWLNLRQGTFVDAPIEGYVGPCGVEGNDLRQFAWTMLIGQLRTNGYAVPALPDAPPPVPTWPPNATAPGAPLPSATAD